MWWNGQTKYLARETADALKDHIKDCNLERRETRRALRQITLWIIAGLLSALATLGLKLLEMNHVLP
jgi:hypothetical protein